MVLIAKNRLIIYGAVGLVAFLFVGIILTVVLVRSRQVYCGFLNSEPDLSNYPDLVVSDDHKVLAGASYSIHRLEDSSYKAFGVDSATLRKKEYDMNHNELYLDHECGRMMISLKELTQSDGTKIQYILVEEAKNSYYKKLCLISISDKIKFSSEEYFSCNRKIALKCEDSNHTLEISGLSFELDVGEPALHKKFTKKPYKDSCKIGLRI